MVEYLLCRMVTAGFAMLGFLMVVIAICGSLEEKARPPKSFWETIGRIILGLFGLCVVSIMIYLLWVMPRPY